MSNKLILFKTIQLQNNFQLSYNSTLTIVRNSSDLNIVLQSTNDFNRIT